MDNPRLADFKSGLARLSFSDRVEALLGYTDVSVLTVNESRDLMNLQPSEWQHADKAIRRFDSGEYVIFPTGEKLIGVTQDLIRFLISGKIDK